MDMTKMYFYDTIFQENTDVLPDVEETAGSVSARSGADHEKGKVHDGEELKKGNVLLNIPNPYMPFMGQGKPGI
jgi:hypothetical protein